MSKEAHSGNSVAANATYVKELVALAENLMRLDKLVTEHMADGAAWGNMTLKPPNIAGGEWMVIARATMEGTKYVAFVSGATLHETLRLLAAKAMNNSLKWMEDRFQ